jgi:hypothetical protein
MVRRAIDTDRVNGCHGIAGPVSGDRIVRIRETIWCAGPSAFPTQAELCL